MLRCWILLRRSPVAMTLTIRRMLGTALIDVAETFVSLGQSLPKPNLFVTDPEMDLEEPIYLHLSTSTQVVVSPVGVVVSSLVTG